MRVELRRACRSPGAARILRDAIAVDTPGFVTLRVRGSDLIVHLTADSAESARATLEDLLACLKAAEKTAGVGA